MPRQFTLKLLPSILEEGENPSPLMEEKEMDDAAKLVELRKQLMTMLPKSAPKPNTTTNVTTIFFVEVRRAIIRNLTNRRQQEIEKYRRCCQMIEKCNQKTQYIKFFLAVNKTNEVKDHNSANSSDPLLVRPTPRRASEVNQQHVNVVELLNKGNK